MKQHTTNFHLLLKVLQFTTFHTEEKKIIKLTILINMMPANLELHFSHDPF